MDIEQLMSLYIDGELDEVQTDEFKKQLEQNDEYKIEFRQFLDIIDSLKSLPKQPLPKDFHNELINKIKSDSKIEIDKNKKSKILKFIPKNLIKISSVAVAACFIVIASGVYYNTTLNKNSNTQSTPRNSAVDNSKSMYEVAESETLASTGAGAIMDMANEAEIVSEKSLNLKQEEKQSDKKIIKTAHLSIQVYDFDNAIENLKQITQQYGGYIENSNSDIIYNDTENNIILKSGNIVLRIPAQNYNDIISYISQTSKVIGNYEQGEDITSNYIDTEAILNAKELEKQRLTQLIEKADNIEDLILLEERLSKVNSELDSYNSKIKNWDRLVQFSTISVSIEQIKEETKINAISPNLNTRIKNGFISSINNIKQKAENLIVWIAQIIPLAVLIIIFLLIIYIIFFTLRKFIKKIKKKL